MTESNDLNNTSLLSPSRVEDELGSKYFYRLKLYRWMEEGLLDYYSRGGLRYFLVEEVVDAMKRSLIKRLKNILGQHFYNFKFKIDFSLQNKEVCVFWCDINNKNYEVEVDSTNEGEELLIAKILLTLKLFHGLPKTYWPGALGGNK